MDEVTLRKAARDDLPVLWDIALGMGAAKNDDYFARSMEQQEQGLRLILIARFEGRDIGYCILSWQPKYAFYRRLEIPEIQDLNVLPEYRRRGIASRMIAHCESLAQEKGCEYIGIGVGLDGSYGAAQRLYVKLGYVPDGNGVTYDRQVISKGELRPVDDDMSLMLIKNLQI